MAYEKQNFTPGQKLKASELNHMEQGIADSVSVNAQSLSESQKAQARENIGAATVDDVLAALQTGGGGSTSAPTYTGEVEVE